MSKRDQGCRCPRVSRADAVTRASKGIESQRRRTDALCTARGCTRGHEYIDALEAIGLSLVLQPGGFRTVLSTVEMRAF